MNEAIQITDLLRLRKSPVAVKFCQEAPSGISRIDQSSVAGCSYWKLAAEGRTFYTVAADHYGCPIGAHTHGVKLPAEKAEELEGLVGTMVKLEYLTMDEVPGIPIAKSRLLSRSTRRYPRQTSMLTWCWFPATRNR